jgi:hypothetical protein
MRAFVWAGALALCALLAIACGGEPPRVDGVVPGAGLQGEATSVVVSGASFSYGYDALADKLTGDVSVFVGGVQLDDLEWRGPDAIAGKTSADLPAGRYAVRVVTAWGEASREGAFVVRSPPED